MNELRFYELFRNLLISGLAAQGYDDEDVEVLNDYQPTIEGTTTRAAIYFFPITDHRYGWPLRSSEWNAVDEVMDQHEKVIIEATMQVTARSNYDITDMDALTTADWVELAAQILQSDVAISALSAQNMGVYRISDIRRPFIIDDQDRNIMAPSFDVTITRTKTLTTSGHPLHSVRPDIYRV